jgi:hypothetical protein
VVLAVTPQVQASATTASQRTLETKGLNQPSPSAQRWELLSTARRVTSRKSLRTCGLYSPEGQVSVSLTERGSASVAGLHTCGSKLCPVCNARTSGKQIGKVQKAAAKLMTGKGCALMLTLTIPHQRGDDLGDLLDALQGAWNASLSGRGGKVWKSYGRTHYLRALDYTHGVNGHHPHFHAVFFFDRMLTDSDLYWLELDLRTRWARSVKRLTGRDVVHAAVKLELVRGQGEGLTAVVRYVGKALTGALLEAVWSHGKTSGGRTLWQILSTAESNPRDRALWQECEVGFHKRRWFVVSRGFLDLAEDEEEKEETEEDTQRDSLVTLSDKLWRGLSQARLVGRFLTAAEQHQSQPERWKRWKLVCELSLTHPLDDWQTLVPASCWNTEIGEATGAR